LQGNLLAATTSSARHTSRSSWRTAEAESERFAARSGPPKAIAGTKPPAARLTVVLMVDACRVLLTDRFGLASSVPPQLASHLCQVHADVRRLPGSVFVRAVAVFAEDFGDGARRRGRAKAAQTCLERERPALLAAR
jgi:hypothetical protein